LGLALLKHVVPSGKTVKSSPSSWVKNYAVERYLQIHCEIYGKFFTVSVKFVGIYRIVALKFEAV
jgi:hypothetical protein